MPPLSDVWRSVCPAARALTPLDDTPTTRGGPAGTYGSAADPEVMWVRVLRARVPALEGLQAGDLAIIPEPILSTLAEGAAEPGTLAADLAHAGVPALLLVGDGPMESLAADLVAGATGRGLPVLRLDGGDPVALERSIVGFLVNRRAELDRQAAQLESRIERLALAGHDMEALAGAIGAFLGRAVAIEGDRGRPLVVHAPASVPEATRAASRYLGHLRHAALRVPLPGGGHLALLGAEPPSELDRAAAERVAPLLALEIERGTGIRTRRDAARGDRLPADGPPWVVLVARQIVPGDEPTLEERAARRERIARLGGSRRVLLRGDVSSLEYRVVAAVGGMDPLGLDLAGRIAEMIGRLVAVSRPFALPEGRPAAEAEARMTLEAAELLPGGGRTGSASDAGVARSDRLPIYRLLSELHSLPAGPRLAEGLLAPLEDGGRAARDRRITTLRAVLDHENAADAARALGVHRNTLLYRVRQLEHLTGWRLDDPDLRLALSVAVRIVQTAQH